MLKMRNIFAAREPVSAIFVKPLHSTTRESCTVIGALSHTAPTYTLCRRLLPQGKLSRRFSELFYRIHSRCRAKTPEPPTGSTFSCGTGQVYSRVSESRKERKVAGSGKIIRKTWHREIAYGYTSLKKTLPFSLSIGKEISFVSSEPKIVTQFVPRPDATEFACASSRQPI